MQNSSRFQWQLQPLPNSTLSGDQITLPPSCISAILSGQDGSDNISYPMTFELLQEQQEKSSIFYGAVREFTADEGTIGLSPHFYNQFIMNTSSSSGGSSSSSRIEEEEATVLLLKVSLKTLPKATSMVLVQDSSSSSSSSSSPPQVLGGDVRSVLESMLRQNYSTLTLNSVLQVVDPESDLNFTTSSPTFTTTPISNTNAATPDPILFRIVKLEPASGVLCLDVDIEVDIQPNPASLTASAISAVPASHWKITRHQMNLTAPLPHNLDNNGKDNIISSGVFESSIDAGSSCFVQVNNPTKLLKFGVEVTPSSPSGDCDLFISESVHQPSYKDHDWYNVDIGPSSCTFRLSDTDCPAFYVCIRNHSKIKPCSFKLQVNSLSPETVPTFSTNTTPTATATISPDPATAKCDNCLAWIPKDRFTMHTAFCYRNQVLCKKCSSVFPKSEFDDHAHCSDCNASGSTTAGFLEKHRFFEHTLMDCDCGEANGLIGISELAAHRRSLVCPSHWIICRFCHLRVRGGGVSRSGRDVLLGGAGTGSLEITVHESQCGARTTACALCNKFVQLKDVRVHMATHKQLKQFENRDRISRLKLCSNQACCQIVKDVKTGSTSSSSMNSNIMDLCSKCYAPFWSPRHDPGNQKIIRKIVEIYHTQFTKGCGKSHCRNLGFCCSSSSSENFLPMEPTAAAARAIELLASTFVQKAHIQEYYFCVGVDETKRRGMAEVLQTMGFPFAWAVKSLVECKDDPDRAASWLLSNAPTS